MSAPPIVVTHPGQQHSYETALAAQEAGLLYRYVTSSITQAARSCHTSALFFPGLLQKGWSESCAADGIRALILN
jgi:hypothetical protein